MERDIGIFDLLKLILRSWYIVLLCMLAGFAGTYFVCLKIKPWYGFSVLLRIPSHKIAIAESSKVAELFGKTSSIIKDTKSEMNAFFNFHYFENPKYTEDELKTAYLSKIILLGDTELVEVIGWGRDIEKAKTISLEAINHINSFYQPRVQQTINDRDTALSLMNSELQNLKNQIKEIEVALKNIGFNPILMQEKAAYQVKMFEIMKEKKLLEVRSGGDNIRPVTILAERIVSVDPVFPKVLLFSAAGALLGLFIGITLVILSARLSGDLQDDGTLLEEDLDDTQGHDP